MTAKLKPCPFCGAVCMTIDTAAPDPNSETAGYGITCHTDGCICNIYTHNWFYKTQKEVIEAWNKRE